MKRALLAALLLLASANLDAASVEMKTKPPYTIDDTIIFSVVTNTSIFNAPADAENLKISWTKSDPMGGGRFRTWFYARPVAEGHARIPAYQGNGEATQPIDLDIRPSDINAADVNEAMKRLKDAGRPPVVAQVSILPSDPMAGDVVKITWSVMSENSVFLHLNETPKIADVKSTPVYGSERDVARNLVFVHRINVATITCLATKPGVLEIPPVVLEGTVGAENGEPVVRHVRGQRVLVQAAPGGVAPGPLTVSVTNVNENRNEVTFDVHLDGVADAGADRAPVIDGRDIAVLLQPHDVQLLRDWQTVHCDRVWSVKVHGTYAGAHLQSVSFTSFDRTLGQPNTTMKTINRDIPRPADTPPETRPARASKADEALLVGVAVTDLMLVIAILVVRAACSV